MNGTTDKHYFIFSETNGWSKTAKHDDHTGRESIANHFLSEDIIQATTPQAIIKMRKTICGVENIIVKKNENNNPPTTLRAIQAYMLCSHQTEFILF